MGYSTPYVPCRGTVYSDRKDYKGLKKNNIFRFLLLALMFALLVSACTPTVTIGPEQAGKTAMSTIYDLIYSIVFWAWFWPALILGIGLAIAAAIFFLSQKSYGIGCLLPLFLLALFVGGGFAVSRSFATNDASTGMTQGADKAKTRKANQFIEKLHVPAVKAVLEKRACRESDGGTDCKYYWTYDYNFHQDCTTVTDYDSKGNVSGSHQECHEDHDTRYVPFFKEEWRTYAYFSMPDEYLLNKVGEDSGTKLVKSEIKDMPMRVYTDWQAPEKYENYLWGPSNRDIFETHPLPGDFGYIIPMEWKVIDASLNAHVPYVATVWHSYVNWVFITEDTNNLVTSSTQVERYKAAGLLPEVKMIYSRYGTPNADLAQDYDFVQFNGVAPENADQWQQAASLAALNVGPTLQGSMIIWFVPAESVDNPEAWITAAKAYLSQKETWGFYMAPKNLVLIGCGVDTQAGLIKFCRMETGMPTGNVEVKQAIAAVKDVPFTPGSFFGVSNAIAQPDSNGFYTSSVSIDDNCVLRRLFPVKDAQGNVVYPGFVRVRMQSMDWLKTDIKLDNDDIIWAVQTNAQAGYTAGWALIPLSIITAAWAIMAALSAATGTGYSSGRRTSYYI